MSVNSSSSSSLKFCWRLRTSSSIMTAYLVVCVLFLLPLFILVLYMGHQRWRKQRSVAAASMTSHSDFFTSNMVAMEIISLFGCCFYICGSYADVHALFMAGTYLFSITSPGQTMFHVLTCLERFLAVVYPVTYLRLRQGGGVRIRNVCTGCVWLLCFTGMYVIEEAINNSTSVLGVCFWVVSSVFTSFFSLSVACVLIRPRPGDGGGDKADKSKQRAFNTIIVILVILMLRCFGFLSALVSFTRSEVNLSDRCAVITSLTWLSLPSSLVLPLLFVHRAGKLPGWKRHPESG